MDADPGGFLLTWIDMQRELIESTYVSSSGVISSPFGKVLVNEVTHRKPDFTPSIIPAFNGQFYLVAWARFVPNPLGPEEAPVNTQIVALRVSTSGEPLDTTPIVISTQDKIGMIDAVLSDGAGFFVAWQPDANPLINSAEQGRFISFSGATPTLSPIVDFGFPHNNSHYFTFDGSKYVTAYIGNSLGNSFTVRRFTSAGLASAPAVTFQASNCSGGGVSLSALTSHGSGESLVVYGGNSFDASAGVCKLTNNALQLNEALQPKFAPVVLPSTSDLSATAAYLGGKYFAWGLQIDPATNAASPTTLQVRGSVACNTTGCVTQSGGNVSRLSLQATPLDPATIQPSRGATLAQEPFVSSGAGQYLVAWTNSVGIYARRVSASGASPDPLPLLIAAPGRTLSGVTFNGTDFLVWGGSSNQNYLTRVSSQGIVKDPDGVAIPSYSQLACRANQCLVAWYGPGISASRLGADGSLLDSPPIQVLPSADPDLAVMLAPSATGYVIQSGNKGATVRLDATGHRVGSAMAGNPRPMYPCGSNFLVFNPLSVVDTYSASLVDSSGAVLVSNVPLGAPVKHNFDVASRADGCAVAWQKAGPTSSDIYANFVASDGSTASPQPIPLATDQFNEREPALAFDGDRLLVAYSHLVPEAPYANYCIAARIATSSDGGTGTGGVGGGGAPSGGGSAGSDGVAGTLGTAGSVGGGFANLGGNSGDTSLGGTAGLGVGALGGAAGNNEGNAAGAIDPNGGAIGQDNDGGASGEQSASMAGMGMTGGHAGTGPGMTGGHAGTAGNAPEPESCSSCRIVGHGPAGNHLPAFAGVLLALATALVRRRSSQGPVNVPVPVPVPDLPSRLL